MPALTEMLAYVRVAARNQLQGLKHADSGAPGEYDELVELLAAVEEFFALGVGLLGAVAPAATLEKVQDRLDPQPKALPDSRRASA